MELGVDLCLKQSSETKWCNFSADTTEFSSENMQHSWISSFRWREQSTGVGFLR